MTDLASSLPEIMEALKTLSPKEVAELIDEVLADRPDVRSAFREKLPPHGINYGDRDDELLHMAPFYNAPTACVAAIMRQNSTQEWELLVGERHNGNKTLIGGYFNPYLPEECNEIFGDDNSRPFSEQRKIAEKIRYEALKELPPLTREEDILSRDADLEATIRKEIFQEAGIFLVPKELSAENKKELITKIRKASHKLMSDEVPEEFRRTQPISIIEDYDIIDKVLPYSGVGTAEPERQINSNGFVIVLNDAAKLGKLEAGDDIKSVEWVTQRRLSSDKSPNKGNTTTMVYTGDMSYGDPEIIDHAFYALISEVPIDILTPEGELAYSAKTEQLVLKIDRICSAFGLERNDVLGELPDPPLGPKAADYNNRVQKFMQTHEQLVVTPFAQGQSSTGEELFEAESELLLKFANSGIAAEPDIIRAKVETTAPKEYKRANVLRNALGLLPTEARFSSGTMSPDFIKSQRVAAAAHVRG